MTLMIIVGAAFVIFCVATVLIITAIAQPPHKAVEYYGRNRFGKPAGKTKTGADAPPSRATVDAPKPSQDL